MSRSKPKKKKPPPRWRRHLVQAELELPPPTPPALQGPGGDPQAFVPDPEWWQKRAFVMGLATLCALLLVTAGACLYVAHRDRALAVAAAERVKTLTLRATTAEHAIRIAPNPRSWSAAPDAVLRWPDPPELLELYLPVAYSEFTSFAVVVDKVDHGRVLVAQRVSPDSNRELRISLNSSAFGPGEYRLRLQGYTWAGERVDAGWIRFVIQGPQP
jgi:hypothetical protein